MDVTKVGISWQRIAALIGLLLAPLLIASCASPDPTAECRQLASDRYGAGVRDNRFTEVTFTDGDFIKGRVGAYVNGGERIVGHWECTTESGSAEITFYSPAAG